MKKLLKCNLCAVQYDHLSFKRRIAVYSHYTVLLKLSTHVKNVKLNFDKFNFNRFNS